MLSKGICQTMKSDLYCGDHKHSTEKSHLFFLLPPVMAQSLAMVNIYLMLTSFNLKLLSYKLQYNNMK